MRRLSDFLDSLQQFRKETGRGLSVAEFERPLCASRSKNTKSVGG